MPNPTLANASAADLKARYPIFADQDNAYVNALLNEARGSVNESWIEGDRVPALLALAAHLIATDQFGSGVIDAGAEMGQVAVAGPLEEVWVGDVKAKFGRGSGASSGGGSSSSGGDGYDATTYGRRYRELFRRSFPAVMVV